ncbi:MAG TPA: LamG domain-containing protein, partial [Pyrinomonadaceae bacterium]|nr:LamG domain-containing protein [Pyrinomonadaceae bacterium]
MKHLANHSRKVTPQFAYVLSAFVLILLVSSWLVPARIGYMFVPRAAAAAFTVTNTNDGGAGSLRKAILDANVNSGPDTIGFNIPPTDPRHFYYQNDGVLGTVSQAMIAATTAADDATIANLDPDWPHSWYSILTNGTRIDIDSEVAIDGYSQPGAQPNTNATGGLNTVLRIEVTTADIPTFNCQSIFNTFSAQHTISGLIINRCGNSAAIYFDVNNTGSIAAGNFIGTDPSGTIALLNGTGIGVERSTIVRIGGNSPADRNLISGNFRGVVIASGTASGDNVSSVSVIGNLVGTARDGISPLGNGFSPQLPTFPEDAISIQSINGTALSNLVERNVIAFNSRYGVTLGGGGVGTTQAVTGNRITNNSIYSNGNIGINLDGLDQGSANAVTPNDPCDVDAGVNGLQNYPVIKDATISGSTIAIAGTLDSAANGSYRIEFFASQASDASFFGEGQTYLGFANVTTAMGSCTSSFSATFSIPPGAGNVISATARDISGNTSEFSAVFIAQAAADSCVMRPPGQVAWLRAQGNTNDSEAGNHGTFSPYTPTYTAGKVGRAFDFTGNVSGGIVRVPDSSDLDFTNAFTMEMWVSPGDVGHGLGGTFFAAKGSLGAASTQSYAMLFTDERKIVNRVSNGSTLDQAVSTAQLPLNTFTHVATTYDGTTLRVYINGVLNSSKATSIGTLLNSTGSLDIGGTFIPGLSLQRNQSLIDEPSLYNRALSDAEVLSIFNAGSMGKCFPRSCAPLLMMD